jgi:hypothetical protein
LASVKSCLSIVSTSFGGEALPRSRAAMYAALGVGAVLVVVVVVVVASPEGAVVVVLVVLVVVPGVAVPAAPVLSGDDCA